MTKDKWVPPGENSVRANSNGTTILPRSMTADLEQGEQNIRLVGPWFKLRGRNDDLPQRWWFASTAIPLLAATTGPLSNVLSIAAIATPWRLSLPNNGQLPEGKDNNGTGIKDPTWELALNALSLVCGFTGNFFLLLNFTGRVRYIISLPMSIIAWFVASGILISITVAMNTYIPPERPGEIYSQGFWHAVFAAGLYLAGAIMLMANMLGYFLGHYPQHFALDDDQRTLILQTMMFFAWLASGAAISAKLEGWTYANALYWADISILTIGFGDIVPKTTGGRIFLVFFEVVGIIFLGLVISSISRFVANISADKVVKRHQKQIRETTIGRTVTSELELRERLGLPLKSNNFDRSRRESLSAYGRFEIQGRKVVFHQKEPVTQSGRQGVANRRAEFTNSIGPRSNGLFRQRQRRREKLVILREEKDRFELMRDIQDKTRRFKKWWALGVSVVAFAMLWLVGAAVFMVVEQRLQQYSYFDALYFSFVSLVTIGYGDLSPQSNIGKPFFIIWSMIAVPTMTVFIQEMSSTVVAAVNRGTFTLADWTILPKKGVVRNFLDSHPQIRSLVVALALKRRLKRGFEVQNPDDPNTVEAIDDDAPAAESESRARKQAEDETTTALQHLADREARLASDSEHDLAHELARAIREVGRDICDGSKKRYAYEHWVHFTKLIRFTQLNGDAEEKIVEEEEERGLVEWDWLGEDSPMLADVGEPAWVLERLCESLARYTRRQGKVGHAQVASPKAGDANLHYQTQVVPTLPEVIREASDEDEESHVGSSSGRPQLRTPLWIENKVDGRASAPDFASDENRKSQ